MFEIKNQSKIKRTSIIMLSMVLILTLVFQCSPFEQKVSAEGSKDINAVEKDTSGKDYYRAYTDYETNATAGIKRETVVYVYAFAGETLYFGSDISNSKIDINENVKSKETDVDIVMTEPNGTKHPFNVIQNGQGHIGTQTKEKTGPYSSSDTAISGNTGGYTPLSYT